MFTENESPAAATNRATKRRTNFSNYDTRSNLIGAMRDAGIDPKNPAHIALDGSIKRFAINGDKPGRDSGWLIGYNDARPAARFGSHRLGIECSWRADRYTPITPAERAEIDRQKAEREARKERAHNAAAERASRIKQDSTPPDRDQGYLIKKDVGPHNARQYGVPLALSLIDFDGLLWSLQFIYPDGTKRLLKDGRKQGCFIHVSGEMPAERVLICEGWATGATLAENDPEALVLAAVDAGNLKPVAIGARKKWPEVEIVICADADPVGREKGRDAAIAADALLAVPEFPPGADGSDFNDLAQLMPEVSG